MKEFENFEQFKSAINENVVNILFFTASWCGPCKSMYPFVTQLSEKNSKYIFF